MSTHPINLAVRFILEISALIAVGFWAWHYGEGWIGYLLAGGLPLAFALAWGVFAVPNDPSRSGSAPIAIPGLLRLLLELGIFSCATWALYDLGHQQLSLILGLTTFIHYLISYDRIQWLLNSG